MVKNKQHKKRMYRYKGKQTNTSIFFLLWSLFTAFSLFIVLLFGFTQYYMLGQTYKTEAARDITQKGAKIEKLIKDGIPSAFGANFSGYLRFLSEENDVEIHILNDDGHLLFPIEHQFDPDAPQIEAHLDYSKEYAEMIVQMQEQDSATVVFEGEMEYVYGSKIAMYGDSQVYLHIEKSMDLMIATMAKLGVRLTLLAVFVVVLAFAISFAVSGWLTKPIREITEKTRFLARGDFNVDFHGADYGKEMVELADMLNFARDELSKTDGMQKELIANVSHDFKTPLTMIKGYASMIMEISGDIPEKRNKHAQVIVEEADRLASLVNDVLDLSKISSGVIALERHVLDMSAYTEEILEKFAYLKDTKGYQFVVDIQDGLYTCADEVKIGQVLYNLIGNAVNYTGEDCTVYVSLKKTAEKTFCFAVRDTGKGIKPEEMSAVWERYYRSSEIHKRPIQGTGLGLSIVKTVLDKHGFEYGIESEVGKGSIFYVVFPLEEEQTLDK